MSATAGTSLQREDRVQEVRRQLASALEQAFVLIDIERREACGACRRMAGVCVAMEELDRALRRAAMIVSWMRSDIATAPIGCAPLVSALAIVIRSGVTPKLCAAKVWPVRPKP